MDEVLGLVGPQWFLSLFSTSFPLPVVCTFWDAVFLDGPAAVFQVR